MRPSPRPPLSTVLSPARYVLRGVSQILFLENAVSGLLILCGLSVMDPRFAALVLLGSATQSLAGWVVGLRDDVRHGLMGYNGALVGAAAGLHTGYSPAAVLVTVTGALACVAVHELVRWLFATPALARFSLPVATAPFCIVAGLIFGAVGQLVEPGEPTTAADLPTGVALGLFNSFSEVLLADGLLCGALIVAALLIDSPTAAGFGLGGAAIALGGAAVVHGIGEASSGLHTYSAVLVAIGLGAVLWADRSAVTRVLGALIGVGLTLLIQPVLELTPVIVFTWPFLLAMWLVLIGSHAVVPERRPVTAQTPEGTAAEPAERTTRRGKEGTR